VKNCVVDLECPVSRIRPEDRGGLHRHGGVCPATCWTSASAARRRFSDHRLIQHDPVPGELQAGRRHEPLLVQTSTQRMVNRERRAANEAAKRRRTITPTPTARPSQCTSARWIHLVIGGWCTRMPTLRLAPSAPPAPPAKAPRCDPPGSPGSRTAVSAVRFSKALIFSMVACYCN
jgi:hypothetical protein